MQQHAIGPDLGCALQEGDRRSAATTGGARASIKARIAWNRLGIESASGGLMLGKAALDGTLPPVRPMGLFHKLVGFSS